MTLPVRRIARYALYTLAGLALVLLVSLTAGYLCMRLSLPQLSGEAALASLSAPVTVTRDERGTVVIEAASMVDVARAIGYVHAQERFFEMDLTRRSAAGELSELFGKTTLKMDKDKRLHRFRTRLTDHLAQLGETDRALLSAYTAGVNSGLAALTARPWQYLVLGAAPQPWREVDTLLVASEMFSTLQISSFERTYVSALLRERVGDAVFEWLRPPGGKWDAALDGSTFDPVPMPTAAQLNTRHAAKHVLSAAPTLAALEEAERQQAIGSNNWAVGGALTAHGGAMLADDMHLTLGVPNIWFRAEYRLKTADGMRRVAGVTLPGVPVMIVGSNGEVAWGFTNTEGRWFDWIPVPKGAPVTEIRERILVEGEAPVELVVRETQWGPIARSRKHQDYALAWTIYQPGAINARLNDLSFARNVDEALAIARQSGVPHQNILLADKAGNIAWTVAGRMPARVRGESPLWTGFSTPDMVPRPWLPPESYPVVKNPADARLWTANNRQMGGDADAKIAEGGFDLGARAQQIRDRLREKDRFTEADLYAIQRDREARFMKHWADLMRVTAGKSATADGGEIATLLAAWNGHADADQVGYRLARSFRSRVISELWNAWIHAAAPDIGVTVSPEGRSEYPVWQALTERPMHLLPQPFASWDAFLIAQSEAVAQELKAAHIRLSEATWGKRNLAHIVHPFSLAIPGVGRVLDMPHTPMPGDNHMPMVLTPRDGASERMVVAPGHEETAILAMPGGQSGHPLSPFYGAGHMDWLEGKPTPLLAGEARYTLTLRP
jgi:penicillin amidase